MQVNGYCLLPLAQPSKACWTLIYKSTKLRAQHLLKHERMRNGLFKPYQVSIEMGAPLVFPFGLAFFILFLGLLLCFLWYFRQIGLLVLRNDDMINFFIILLGQVFIKLLNFFKRFYLWGRYQSSPLPEKMKMVVAGGCDHKALSKLTISKHSFILKFIRQWTFHKSANEKSLHCGKFTPNKPKMT